MSDQAQNLRAMMNRHRKKNADTRNARVVAIASGKDGAGKSWFSVNLAAAMKKLGSRVLLIDADSGAADFNVMPGANPGRDLSGILKNVDINDIIAEDANGVKFISGGSRIYDFIKLNPEQLQKISGSLLRLEDSADIIIFNAAAGVSDDTIRLIKSSDETIVVSTPESASIMDSYALIKIICAGGGHPRVRVVMNKSENAREAAATLEKFANVALKYIEVAVEPLGHIPFDPLAAQAAKKKVPLIDNLPKSAAAQSINAIAELYLGTIPKSDGNGGLRRFIGRFFSKEPIAE